PLGHRRPHAERGDDGDDRRQPPVDGVDEPHQDEEQRQRARDEPDGLEAHAVDQQQPSDRQHLAPARAGPERGQRGAAGDDGLADDAERERAHQDADPVEGKAGAGLVQTSEPHVAPGPDHEGADRQPEQAAPELGVADHVNPFPWRMPGSARRAGYSFLARPIFSSAAFSLTMNASTDLRYPTVSI